MKEEEDEGGDLERVSSRERGVRVQGTAVPRQGTNNSTREANVRTGDQ